MAPAPLPPPVEKERAFGCRRRPVAAAVDPITVVEVLDLECCLRSPWLRPWRSRKQRSFGAARWRGGGEDGGCRSGVLLLLASSPCDEGGPARGRRRLDRGWGTGKLRAWLGLFGFGYVGVSLVLDETREREGPALSLATLCLPRIAPQSKQSQPSVPSMFDGEDHTSRHSALQIVGALRAMAESRGRTVVLSIHQPGARIVKMFDAVLLLAAGSVLHHGSVDELHSLLAGAGLCLPPHVDAVEFAIDSVDELRLHLHLQQQQQQHQRDRRCTLQQLFQQHKLQAQAEDDTAGNALAGGGSGTGQHRYANSWPVEVAVLSQRFFKNVARTRQLFACRTVVMLVAGLALGSIFYDLGDDKVAERVGLFAFLLTFLLSSTTEALPVFLQEREILAKETSSGAYRVSAYAVANALVFLPFQLVLAAVFAAPAYWLTGLRRTAPAFFYFLLLIWLVLYTANSVVSCFAAAAPDFVVGNAAVQGVMGSFFLFSGYFIRRSAMPAYWVPMHYLSLFKWPFEALLLNEFGGRCAATAMGVCVATGDEVLRREGIGEECRWRNVAVMVGFVAFYRLLGYAVLRVRCSLTLRAAARSACFSAAAASTTKA